MKDREKKEIIKKYRPNHRYTIVVFVILFLLADFLLWSIFGTKPWKIVEDGYKPNFIVDIIYNVCSFGVATIGFFVYYFVVYYEIKENCIIRHSTKNLEIRFKDIVFVDENYSKKKIDVKLYINTNKWLYITDTKSHDLYYKILEKSTLLDEEDFFDRYPKACSNKK